MEAFPDPRLVLPFSIVHHVIFIGAYNISLDTKNVIHLFVVYKSLHSIRHATDYCILQQKLLHATF